MAEEKKSKDSDRYALAEIVVQKDIAIVDSVNPEQAFTDKGILLEILNKLDRIEKSLG